ncbi:MAG: hypothetical protein GY827_03720 [Cytophagales bacterium]|nr:hypothetical protein [Cytophagales bacterium]
MQYADFPIGAIIVVISIIIWIVKAVRGSKQNTNNATDTANTTPSQQDLIYQQKLAEFAKRRQEKQAGLQKEKEFLLKTAPTPQTPTYQAPDTPLNQYAKYNSYGMTKQKEEVLEKVEHLEHYHIEKKSSNKMAKILQDKDKFKQAFVLSEVLQRKY